MSWQTLSYPVALAALERAQRIFAEESDSRVALTQVADIGDSVLAFLRHALDSDGVGPIAPPPDQAIWELLPLLFKNLDDRQVTDLLGDILFGARHPAVYGVLAQGLRWRVPASVAEAAVLTQLSSSEERCRRNAVSLSYFLFQEDPRYQMSEAGRRAVGATNR